MSRLSKAATLWWTVSAAWMGAIFLGSAESDTSIVPLWVNDKVLHFLIYASLALFLLRALSLSFPAIPFARASILLLAWVALFGASDEWHQAFVPNREVSLGDWLADLCGAGALLLASWWRLSRQRSSELRRKESEER